MTAAGIDATYIQGYANSIIGIINGILVPVLIAIAFIVFLWGIYKYFIQGAANESEKGEGRMFALYGIIGFVILFSVWGIVQIFMGTLGLGAAKAPAPPTFDTTGAQNAASTNTTIPAPAATVGGGSPCAGGNRQIGSLCCNNSYCDSGYCAIDNFGVSRCASNSNTTTGGNY